MLNIRALIAQVGVRGWAVPPTPSSFFVCFIHVSDVIKDSFSPLDGYHLGILEHCACVGIDFLLRVRRFMFLCCPSSEVGHMYERMLCQTESLDGMVLFTGCCTSGL